MKTGYQVIYLHHADFTVGTEKTVPGVYDAIEGNYYKPTLLSDFSIGGTEQTARFVNFTISGTSFVCDINGTHTMTVADDDGITIAANS